MILSHAPTKATPRPPKVREMWVYSPPGSVPSGVDRKTEYADRGGQDRQQQERLGEDHAGTGQGPGFAGHLEDAGPDQDADQRGIGLECAEVAAEPRHREEESARAPDRVHHAPSAKWRRHGKGEDLGYQSEPAVMSTSSAIIHVHLGRDAPQRCGGRSTV